MKRVSAAFLLLVLVCPVHGQDEVALPDAVAVEKPASDVVPEIQARWPYLAAITIPGADGTLVAETTPRLVDFFQQPAAKLSCGIRASATVNATF